MLYVSFFPDKCLLRNLTGGREGQAGRLLIYQVIASPMTIDICTAACQGEGYSLAGVEYADECCMYMIKPHKLMDHYGSSPFLRVWKSVV